MRAPNYTYGIIALIMLGVFCSGWWVGTQSVVQSSVCDKVYEFIHESVWCDASYVIQKHAYSTLRGDMLETIEDLKESGEIVGASVYFRDLRRGPVFGINEYESFFPATLLKIVLVTTYYDFAKEYPELLSEVIWSTASTFQARPVRELLALVARDSDSEAYTLLRDHLRTLPPGEDLLAQRARELGFAVPDGGVEEAISTKDYSSMLHSLFFARFLPPESANEILQLMRAPDGASHLAPAHVPVSRRSGTQTLIVGERVRTYECGIVYFPGNPYSLCIVITGHDEEKMRSVLVQLSSEVYREIEKRRIGVAETADLRVQ